MKRRGLLLFGGVLSVVIALLVFVFVFVLSPEVVGPPEFVGESRTSAPPTGPGRTEARPSDQDARTSRRRTATSTPATIATSPEVPTGFEALIVRNAFTTRPVPNVRFVITTDDPNGRRQETDSDAGGRLLVPIDGVKRIDTQDDKTWKMSPQTVGAMRLSGAVWVHARMRVVVNVTSSLPRVPAYAIGPLELSWRPPGGTQTPTALAVQKKGDPRFVRLSGWVGGVGRDNERTFHVPRVAGLTITPTSQRWMQRAVEIPMATEPGGEVRMTLALKEPVALSGQVFDRETGDVLPGSDVRCLVVRRDGTVARIPNRAKRGKGGEFRFGLDPLATPRAVLYAEGYKRHAPLRRTFDVSRGSVSGVQLHLLRLAEVPEATWKRGGKLLTLTHFWVQDETVTPAPKIQLWTDEEGFCSTRHLEVGHTYRAWVPSHVKGAFETRFTFNGEIEISLPTEP